MQRCLVEDLPTRSGVRSDAAGNLPLGERLARHERARTATIPEIEKVSGRWRVRRDEARRYASDAAMRCEMRSTGAMNSLVSTITEARCAV